MLTIRPINPEFVAEITGVPLEGPLDEATVGAIRGAIDRYGVVFFPGQRLDNDSQLAFARRFGEVQAPSQSLRRREAELRLPEEISDISNLDANNQVVGRNSRRRMDALGNLLWHTDVSFRAVPGQLSMLYGHRVPSKGGETEFADCRAAYDSLPEEMKAQIDDLIAIHSVWHARKQLGFDDFTEAEMAVLPPVRQRLVRRHPGSGRKTLYIAAHASHIEGWEVPEGRILLHELIERATQREFTYRHNWTPGDLVIWDNRCTMHRGRPYDPAEVRDLRRITTRDVASTLDQAA